MTAKEYLSQLKTLDNLIARKRNERDDLMEKLTVIGSSSDYSKDRVQRSMDGSAPYEKTIQRITDLDEELGRLVDYYIDRKKEIVREIEQIPDKKFVDILYKRYVEYKSLKEIAEEMKYSYDRVRHIHGYALESFKNIHMKAHFDVL